MQTDRQTHTDRQAGRRPEGQGEEGRTTEGPGPGRPHKESVRGSRVRPGPLQVGAKGRWRVGRAPLGPRSPRFPELRRPALPGPGRAPDPPGNPSRGAGRPAPTRRPGAEVGASAREGPRRGRGAGAERKTSPEEGERRNKLSGGRRPGKVRVRTGAGARAGRRAGLTQLSREQTPRQAPMAAARRWARGAGRGRRSRVPPDS